MEDMLPASAAVGALGIGSVLPGLEALKTLGPRSGAGEEGTKDTRHGAPLQKNQV